MTAPLTADLETGAGPSASPTSTESSSSPLASPEPQSLDALMDAALEGEGPASPEPIPGVGVDRGDGRDVRGKFATPAEQAAAAAKAAATTPAPPAPGTKPPAPNTPAAGEQTPAVVASPFRYRALGQTHELEGSTVDADGNTVIPAAVAGRLREAFNALHLVQGEFAPTIEKYKTDNQQLAARVKELTEGRGASETKAEALVSALTAAFQEPDDEKALAMMWQLRSGFPKLLSDAERDHWKQEAERARTSAAPPAPAAGSGTPAPAAAQPRSMPTADAARATTTEYVEQFKIHHAFRDLTPADWKQLDDRYKATPFAFLRLATADDAQKHAGVQPGEVVFDTDALEADIRTHASTTATQRETARRTTELATANARRTMPSVAAPPTASGTQAPPKSPRRFNSKEEHDAWWQSDEFD